MNSCILRFTGYPICLKGRGGGHAKTGFAMTKYDCSTALIMNQIVFLVIKNSNVQAYQYKGTGNNVCTVLLYMMYTM